MVLPKKLYLTQIDADMNFIKKMIANEIPISFF